jgi:hypothetical protein
MKIPLYTSQARPSGEAPGRSFSARMQAEPFIRAEIEKGNTFGAAASQIAEFADMRYKMAREAKLNDALIAADEQLREETRSLADSKDIYNVLDGDDPYWNKNVEGIRNTLRSQLGKDRESLRIFDEQFKKSEITQRFRLRGVVDTKIEQRIQAQRKRKLETAEDNSVAAATIDDIFLNLSDIKIDGARTAQVLRANPDALDGQQAVLLKNIANRRMQILLDNSENPIATMSILRTAALSGDTSGLTDPRLGGKGLVEAELLSMMPLADRISILSGGETLAKYVDGPTLEEEAIKEKAAASLGAVSSEATEVLSLLEKNIPVSDAQIDGIEVALNKLSSTLPADQVLPVQEVLTDARDFKKFKDEILQVGATPRRIQEVITEIESKPDLGSEDVKYLNYASKLLKSTVDAIEKDPIAWAQSTGNIGGQPLDLSFSDPAETAQQFKVRALDANRVHALSGRGAAGAEFRLLSEAEENALVENFQNGPLSQKMSVLMGLQAAFDTGTPKSQELLQDMYVTIADKEPLMAHAGGLIAMGRQDAAREILQGLEQLNSGVQIPKKTVNGTDVGAVISSNLQEALRFQPQATGAIIKATEAIIANRFLGATKDDLTDDDVLAAMQTAAGQYNKNDVAFGGLQLVNDAMTFMPKDASVDRFEQVMDNLTPEMMAIMGYEVDPRLWEQVAEGNWTFQVAGEGQYRIMQDEGGVSAVPTFLNGFNLERGGEAEPVLIDFYTAEKVLMEVRRKNTDLALTQIQGEASGFGQFSETTANLTAPEIEAATDVSPVFMEGFEETKGIFSAQLAVALKGTKNAKQKSKAISKLVPPDRFKTSVQPLLKSVPDDVSNEEYVEYVDAVLNGFGKSFKDWKASQ